MHQVIVIPARMKGTRLPGKPLIKILGKTVLQRVWERCSEVMNKKNIYVATEDKDIQKFCTSNSIQCVVTKEAETAIDRIKYFSDIIKADAYLNIQGDEPIVNIKDIKTLIDYNNKYPDRVVFGKAKANKDEFEDYSKAKVVCGLDGRLLYSSRAGIPINNKGNFVTSERAIWLYAFNKLALDKYNEYSNRTKLDMLEDNEIIRFLEINIPVYCVDMIGDSWAVDEKKDLKIVEDRILKEKKY